MLFLLCDVFPVFCVCYVPVLGLLRVYCCCLCLFLCCSFVFVVCNVYHVSVFAVLLCCFCVLLLFYCCSRFCWGDCPMRLLCFDVCRVCFMCLFCFL